MFGADPAYVPVSPLRSEDPPKIGEFWIDARLTAAPAGIAFTAHDAGNTPAMVILLAEGAAADPAARSRFAGEINALHIDTVLARGGQGQDTGRLARKFRKGDEDPVAPDERLVAPWAALAYDGSPAAAAQAAQILDVVQIATLPPQGVPSGPEYQQYWIDRYARPGPPLAAAVARPLRPRGLANDLGLMAAHGVARGARRADRDLDLPNQPPQSPPSPTGSSASQSGRRSQGRHSLDRNQDPRSRRHLGIADFRIPGPSGLSRWRPADRICTGSPRQQSPRSRL
jgi:hypothetical protein